MLVILRNRIFAHQLIVIYFRNLIFAMNKDLVEIYNRISDLKTKLPNVDVNLDFPEIVVVGAQVTLSFLK